ncbi:MAG: SpoIIAA-like [Thermoleophilia bacterium]|nr:SpoIIAA-like [Thermoleophilia bacterium]
MEKRSPSADDSTLYNTPVSQRHASGDVVLELHDESRLIALSCVAPGRLTEDDARAFAPPLTAWMDGWEGRIYFAIDCTDMSGTDAGWRSIMFDTLSPHRSRLRMVWFRVNSVIAIMAKMFITALSTTGPFDGKVFRDRDAALRWLERDVN